MPLPVKLSDVVDQLEIVGDQVNVYLNRKTGEFVVLTEDEMAVLDDDDDFDEFDDDELDDDEIHEESSNEPEWMREAKQIRREVYDSDDYVQLPDKFDLHDWQIMQDFCLSVPRSDVRAELLDLIRGRGAFSRFNSAIRGLRLENAWREFRNETYERVATDWLQTNEIPFIGGSTKSKSTKPHEKRPMEAYEQKSTKPHETTDTKRFNPNEIKVFISHRDSKCDECGEELGRQAWITLEENKGALCLACADLDLLVFLPSGDAALTRRSKKYSTLSAVVLKFSRARKQYERQGSLVEESALAQAEAECLADSEVRERRNERASERRAELDQDYIKEFAKRIRALYPNCPAGREQTIAEHACLKYSGRVGRSAAARSFDEDAVRLAVSAHVRHRETNYDSLLADGWFRGEARAKVRDRVEAVLEKWRD